MGVQARGGAEQTSIMKSADATGVVHLNPTLLRQKKS